VAAYIDEVVHSRRDEMNWIWASASPTGATILGKPLRSVQKVEFMLAILRRPFRTRPRNPHSLLSGRAEPGADLPGNGSVELQFRLLKSRAKARFGEIGKLQIATKSRLGAVSMRTFF